MCPRYSDLGAYALGLSGTAAVIAGVVATKIAKKKSKEYFKDLNVEPKVVLESPTALAFRALAVSTVISVGIFSVAIFGFCKWANINNLDDLRAKVNSLRKHKVTNSDERTEFENLTDFLTYLSEKYDSKTKAKTKTIGENE
ncbi:conserved hypothetical protein [Pediculus humanus corporis]|uniref:Transmembrane protein 242 n=1 Tax=Pediculus humanus subsp. corporis TaxID=121224 RepID=E0W384_PEDHC|nr:uncharacterized protein Phum_PHUM602100 [Pediculus humanus corporis]EEB20090.1 conserved hypothetical protein [Pediculus humanus corporis]